MIGGGRGEVLQYDWVSFLTQRGQVADVQLQFTAILIEIQERRENLEKDRVMGDKNERESFYYTQNAGQCCLYNSKKYFTRLETDNVLQQLY